MSANHDAPEGFEVRPGRLVTKAGISFSSIILENPCKACGLHEENEQPDPPATIAGMKFYVCETVPPGKLHFS